ncbi:hypothetical protein D6856_14715 [Butyrivibrio sp. XB500-5]|uniref:hypothetical protein n=1 Tax=Butyrivibrio sp. XB500-5 TaxID=2364880 RepID=UPI000EAA773A|nr:hypothetical protein [Butyrivibrio sp. XB500-5]RKM56746.1 hypothetical protein D6856_14715 [Butyrivibrio sp. XB500-5]
MYDELATWIDKALAQGLPEEFAAACFNIYEDADNSWSLELVGCSSFAPDDEDWACNEVSDFGTRENPFTWNSEDDWETVLADLKTKLTRYLETGSNADKLTKLDGVAVGFVDGDLIIL